MLYKSNHRVTKTPSTLHVVLLILFFNLLRWNAECQVTQEWVSLYTEPPSNRTRSIGICLDKNGFIYVGGLTTDPNNKFVALKYNSSGTLLWSSRYVCADSIRVWAFGMAIDSSGNVYVTGEIGPSFGPFDIITVKFSSINGDTLWTRRYKAPNGWESQPQDVCVDKCGNIYVVGATTGTNSLVIKYSPQGDTLWTRLNYFNSSLLNACAVDDSCNLYATGYNDASPVSSHSLTLKYSPNGVLRWYRSYTDSSSINICIAVDSLGNSYSGGVIRHPSGGGGNFTVFKYNQIGNLIWHYRYIMPMYRGAQPNQLSVNRVGTYIVAAGTGAFGQPATSDYLTIGLNALNGDTLWTRIYNGSGNANDEIYSIVMDKYNSVYVTGRSSGTGTGFDCATIKYNNSGMQQWEMRYNDPQGNGDDVGVALITDKQYNIYVTATSTTGTFKSIATIKYSQLIGVNPIYTPVIDDFKLFQNYPNPFNLRSNIEYEISKSGYYRMIVYDITGKEVKTLFKAILKKGNYKISLDGENLPSGVYFYRLFTEDYSETKQMILIK